MKVESPFSLLASVYSGFLVILLLWDLYPISKKMHLFVHTQKTHSPSPATKISFFLLLAAHFLLFFTFLLIFHPLEFWPPHTLKNTCIFVCELAPCPDRASRVYWCSRLSWLLPPLLSAPLISLLVSFSYCLDSLSLSPFITACPSTYWHFRHTIQLAV